MHKSPSYRFDRSDFFVPQQASKISESPKYLNYRDRISKKLKTGEPFIRKFERFNSQPDDTQKIQERIVNLQLLLEKEKYKRQSQFYQLFQMINSIKVGKQQKQHLDELPFQYGQLQFPITPRSSVRESQSGYQNLESYTGRIYTPSHHPIQKRKDTSQRILRQKEQIKYYNDIFKRFFGELLENIQKQTQNNNLKISSIQEQMNFLKSKNSKSAKSLGNEQLSIQVQKFLRQQIKIARSQYQVKQKNGDQLRKQIHDKLDERFKLIEKTLKEQNQQHCSQISQKIEKINEFYKSQIKCLEQKTSSQVFTINDIVQQKFKFFRESLLNQVFKQSKQDDKIKIYELIQKQKQRIDQIQESNSSFYTQLEKTMENIQKKLKTLKTEQTQNEKALERQFLTGIIKKQKDNIQRQLSSQMKKTNSKIQKMNQQIKQLEKRLQKFVSQKQVISNPSLVKQKSISTRNTHGTVKEISRHEWTPVVGYESAYKQMSSVRDDSFEDSNFNLNQQQFQLIISKQTEQILCLLSQNCTFLQSRNCAIQQSVAQVVFVLNNLVERIKRYI